MHTLSNHLKPTTLSGIILSLFTLSDFTTLRKLTSTELLSDIILSLCTLSDFTTLRKLTSTELFTQNDSVRIKTLVKHKHIPFKAILTTLNNSHVAI